ncbi:hypothetical protein XFEB_00273 [Xylella fastidiosa EB92.1]|nr:hypothetical protein XFEB_00273 [Xylella fastidiosa EB92.1]
MPHNVASTSKTVADSVNFLSICPGRRGRVASMSGLVVFNLTIGAKSRTQSQCLVYLKDTHQHADGF